ncbi:MAG: hypothetical protein WC686_04335 [Candidatus Shapirobacteria bacterium]
MKHMERSAKLITFALVAWATFVAGIAPKEVAAQYYSQGEQKNKIVVDKKLRYIYDEQFSDNIDSSKRIFADGEIVEFQIKIENSGIEKIENILANDTLPSNLSLIFFPGDYDATKGVVSWKIDKLEKGESKRYYIRAKVIGEAESGNQNVKKVNLVEARSGDLVDSDNASYFVAKKVVPVTGAGDLIWQTGVVVSLGIGALRMRKAARGF